MRDEPNPAPKGAEPSRPQPPQAALRKSSWLRTHPATSMALALILFVTLAAGWQVAASRSSLLKAATESVRTLGFSAKDRIDTVMRSYELLLTDIGTAVLQQAKGEITALEFLGTRLAAYPEINNAFITDSGGKVVVATLAQARGVSIGDRAYFKSVSQADYAFRLAIEIV
ncbi:MAG: hypothetical protein IT565_01185, partial [Rhodospirillales bacterium]|nr:hypothetical protein [Rhodospirillales bacterium]